MIRNWTGTAGLFASPADWSPAGAPAPGDTLYAQSGLMVLFGGAFGSAATPTALSLIGATAASAPTLALLNVTLRDVNISTKPPPFTGPTAPSGYYAPRYGSVMVGGRVVNDGGTFAADRGTRVGGNDLRVSVMPGSVLVNRGTLASGPDSQLTLAGGTVQNDGRIVAAGGRVTVSAHLTGVGDASVSDAGVGLNSALEVQGAVDAGQTVHIARGVLQLDQPPSFLGAVELPSAGVLGGVFVEGLSPASWDVKGNLLELFNGAGARIDTLRFTTTETATSLAVYERPDPTYGHTVLVASSTAFPLPQGDTVVPYHAGA